MAITKLRSKQIGDGEIKRINLNTTTPSSAVITKVVTGTGISLGSTGIDAGTGDVTINIDSTVITTTGTQTLQNKSLVDNTTFLIDNADATKKVKFEVSGISPSTTRTITIPDLNLTLAGLDSPAFTGIPLAPTATAGTNTTQLATTAFVQTSISNLVNAAPSQLDTLNELATALGNDANFATTITNQLAGKQPTGNYITALTGDVTASGPNSASATVIKLQGRNVSSTAPSASQYLGWNTLLSQWEPKTITVPVTSIFGRIGDVVAQVGDYSSFYEPANANIQAHIANTSNPHNVTKAQVGLSLVENTALSTWAGSANITTLGTVISGTWHGSIVEPTYLGSGTPSNSNYLRGDGTWQTVSGMGIGNAITNATAGSVLFAGASGVLAQDNANFFWDTSAKQLQLRKDVNGLASLLTLTNAQPSGKSSGIEFYFYRNATSTISPSGRIYVDGFAGGSDHGTLTFQAGSNGGWGTSFTFDVNGNLTAPTLIATSTVYAGSFPIGFYYGSSPTVLRHGLWASDHLDMYVKAGNTTHHTFDYLGNFGIGYSTRAGIVARLHVNAGASSTIGAIVQGAVSQSANLQEWRNSAGVALSVVDAGGNLGVGISTPAARLHVESGSAHQLVLSGYNPNGGASIWNGALKIGNGGRWLRLQNAGNAGATHYLDLEASNDAFAIRNNAGATPATIFAVAADGSISLTKKLNASDSTQAQISITGWSAMGGASSWNGEVLFGLNNNQQGRIGYDGSSGLDFYFDNAGNSDNADFIFRTKTSATPINALTVKGSGSVGIGTASPASLLSVGANSEFQVRSNGSIKPASMADASAANDSIYYSTDQNKLCYKNSGGVVNTLY